MNLTAYLEWRIAFQRWGRRPWQLGADERASVQEQAARERRVIATALGAPEAAPVHADPEVTEAVVAEMARDGGNCPAFLAELARGGLDETGLREAIAMELRAGLVLQRVEAAVVVDEAEVHAYFARQKARLVLPERRAARHILITLNDAYEENRREGARRRLGELADALAAGAEFGALAMGHSECPTAFDGGRLGQVRRGQLYPELDAALFALGPGEVRAVESPLGFHLLRCDAVLPAEPIRYEAAAPAIRRKLEARARDRALREWLAQAERGEPPAGAAAPAGG